MQAGKTSYSMTAVVYKASSGVARPEGPWGGPTPEHGFNRYFEVPALKEAGRARGHHVERAKRARSLQGAGTASGDEVRSVQYGPAHTCHQIDPCHLFVYLCEPEAVMCRIKVCTSGRMTLQSSSSCRQLLDRYMQWDSL